MHYTYMAIVLYIAPGRHRRRRVDLRPHLRTRTHPHASATRISTLCALLTSKSPRMSDEKSRTIVRTPSTPTVQGLKRKPRIDLPPLDPRASAKNNPRPTTLLSTQQQFKTARDRRQTWRWISQRRTRSWCWVTRTSARPVSCIATATNGTTIPTSRR